MGQIKQLLHVRGRPMLSEVVEHAASAGLEATVVVTRSEVAASVPLGGRRDVLVVRNDDPGTEMIDSIVLGVDRTASEFGLNAADGILVLPGDCPDVPVAAIRQCADAYRGSPDCLVVATYRGKRGHPLVFPAARLERVRGLSRSGGLNQLLRDPVERVVEVPSGEAGVLRDVDTPDDRQALDESDHGYR